MAGLILTVFLALTSLCTAAPAAAENTDIQVGPGDSESPDGEEQELLQWFSDHATLNGLAEFNFDYSDVSDTEDADGGRARDFYIGTLELALRVLFSPWARAKVVANLEDVWIDDGDEKFNLDEAYLRLRCPWIPLYFVGGKTTLPFGMFEDHLIVGTLIEDLYEIKEVGATLGFEPDFYGLNIALTMYKGQTIIENLADFGTHEFGEHRDRHGKPDSYIGTLKLAPMDDRLLLWFFYDNAPGDGRRNQSIGAAATLNIWQLSLDAEYVRALRREDGDDEEENRESAGFVGLAFEPFEDLELAVRCEFFDDDRPGPQDETVEHRYIGGFNYLFWKYATFSFEYRYTKFEREADSEAVKNQNELFFQLALEF